MQLIAFCCNAVLLYFRRLPLQFTDHSLIELHHSLLKIYFPFIAIKRNNQLCVL